MAKKTSKVNLKWARAGLYVFWAVLGVFTLLLIAQYGYLISGSEASLGFGDLHQMELDKAAIARGEGGGNFATLVCRLMYSSGYFIGALALLMMVSSGVVYATSQGQSGGEGSGIGLAKSMMVAALSGVALYVFGIVLLGTCGTSAGGGLLQEFINKFGAIAK